METTFQKNYASDRPKTFFLQMFLMKAAVSENTLSRPPEDIQKTIDAGYSDKLKETIWAFGQYYRTS